MKNRYLFKVGFACALLCASMVYSSCGNEDEPTPSNQNTSGNQNQNPTGGNNNQQTGGNENENPNKPSDEVTLVSELKCTVDEFAAKYTTLKKGEKVTITLTDVSDANIAKVSETLKNMQPADPISKAGEAKYIVSLILESINNALKTIPADTFKGVEVLREVVIPACVEAIQSDAFAECVNLVSAKILGADTKVDEKAFENANEEIKVEQTQKEVVEEPEDPEVIDPEVKLLSPADIVDYVNASDEEIVTLNMALETYDHTDVMIEITKITDKKVKLVIPKGIKDLVLVDNKLPRDEDDGLIYEPIALVAVVIPEGMTSIGNEAFGGCSSLSSITIPKSVNMIGPYAFACCSSLTNISIPESVTMIDEGAFSGCTNLANITIPQSVTFIDVWAFEDCSSLSSISIPESLTMICMGVFSGCSNLTSITIPKSVTMIGDWAFSHCDNLQTIYCSQAIYDEYHDQYPQMVVKK